MEVLDGEEECNSVTTTLKNENFTNFWLNGRVIGTCPDGDFSCIKGKFLSQLKIRCLLSCIAIVLGLKLSFQPAPLIVIYFSKYSPYREILC